MIDIKGNPLNSRIVAERIIEAALPLVVAFALSYFSVNSIYGLPLGLIAFIFVPGTLLTKIIFTEIDWAQRFGFAFILGIGIQIINVFILYSLTAFIQEKLQFLFLIALLTSIWVVCFSVLLISKNQMSRKLSITCTKPWVVFSAFCIALALRLFFQNFSLNPYTDTALYMDFARNIASGAFTTNVSGSNWSFFSYGLVPHMGTSFVFSTFFSLASSSFLVAKIALTIFGSIIVFPIFALTKEIFNEKVASIAVIITAFYPLLILYSSSFNGPEIISAVFVIVTLLFFTISVKMRNKKLALFSGFFAFFVFITWYPNFYTLILFVPLLYAIQDKHGYKSKAASILIGAYFLIAFRFTTNLPSDLLWYIGVPIILISSFLLVRKAKTPFLQIFFLSIFCLVNISFIRSFLHPEVYIHPASQVSSTFISNVTELFGRLIPSTSSFFDWLSSYYLQASVLVSLSFLSLLSIRKISYKVFFILYPIVQLGSYALFMPDNMRTGFDASRTLVAISIPIVILSAVSIESLLTTSLAYSKFTVTKSILITFFKKYHLIITNKKIIAAFLTLIVCVAFAFPFFGGYADALSIVQQTNLVEQNNWAPAMEWINHNIKNNDTIMARKTYDWAWYSNRHTVSPDNSSIGLDDLYAIINRDKINYLIVDRLFYNDYPNLRMLYADSGLSPIGLTVVYSSFPGQTKLLIYNTSDIISHKVNLTNQVISPNNSLFNWSVWFDSTNNIYRGNLTVQISKDANEPNSVHASSVLLTSDYSYITKFQYNFETPLTLQATKTLTFPFKMNISDTLMDKMIVQFIDKDSNYLTFSIPSNIFKNWKTAEIPIDSQSNSLKPQSGIIFWFTSKQAFSVDIGPISIQRFEMSEVK